MTTETPTTWAIERALELGASRLSVTEVLEDLDCTVSGIILALATMIAKYEQPVDPVALVLADYWEICGWQGTAMAVRDGEREDEVAALRAALEKHGMLK